MGADGMVERRTDMITKKDILKHAEKHGNGAAVDLLLLAGPDGFDGTYSEYKDLFLAVSEDEPKTEYTGNFYPNEIF